MKRFLQLAFLALFLAPTAALAHTGVGDTSGFMHGFMHPLGDLDHQLAMILVGIFAYQLGGRAMWLVPLTFVAVMAFGGFLGISGIPVPFIQIGIPLSVVVPARDDAVGVKVTDSLDLGRKNAEKYGVNIDLRLGYGMSPLQAGEVDVLVISGLGSQTITEVAADMPDVVCASSLIALRK